MNFAALTFLVIAIIATCLFLFMYTPWGKKAFHLDLDDEDDDENEK